MKVIKLDSIPPGNPFLHDVFNMGTRIGSNVVVMYANFQHDSQNYIIVVNTDTGERICIDFKDMK